MHPGCPTTQQSKPHRPFPHSWKLRRMWLNSTRPTPRLHFFNAATKSGTHCFSKFEAQVLPNNPSACGWSFLISLNSRLASSRKRRPRQALPSTQPGIALARHIIHARRHNFVRTGFSCVSPALAPSPPHQATHPCSDSRRAP